jgi:O-antigen/teichoic acid export membrane protein
MEPAANSSSSIARASKGNAARTQVRGSSLLLVGRFLAIGINFAAQVLMVRYLSTADYGALAYALSVVAFCQTFATLGLDRAVTRFVPIYHETHEYGKLCGTLLLVVSTIALTGAVAILTVHVVPASLFQALIDDQQPFILLGIMIFLVPVEALDQLFIQLFACFTHPRAIFFRKYVLGPGLKLSVILILIAWQRDVMFLAYGYLAASALGVLIYGWILLRGLYQQGLFRYFQLTTLRVPAREIFAFTIPLLTSDLVTVVMHSVDVFLLGYFHDTAEVAMFRVVLPAVSLNKIVMTSFALLFTPAAARLFAKDDYRGIHQLYWQTAIWIAVLSFPIFAVTFSLAQPLTVFLYGERYAQSGVILALLSLGYYFSAALGFNGLTLKVLGKVRYIVMINVVAAVVNAAANLLLIPRYGALGAALGTAGTLIIHNILKQLGLRLEAGLSMFDHHYLPFYLLIGGSASGLLFLQYVSASSIYVALPLAGLVSLFALAVSKKKLHIGETFPELLKVPLMRRLLG